MLDTEGENWQLSPSRNVHLRLEADPTAEKVTGGHMTVKTRFSSGVAWLAIGNWSEQAINFLVFVLLARLLGAESFGLLAMASVFVVLSEFLVRESISEYLIAAPDPTAQDYNAVFWILLVLASVLALAIALAAGKIAAFYDEPDVAALIHILMLTVPLIAATAVPVSILRRGLRFRELAVRAVAGVIVGGIVGVGMATAGQGVWSLAGQRVATVATNVALAWFAVGWRPGFGTSRAHLTRAAHFGGQVLGLRAAELAATQVPSLVIGASLGAGPLGLYSVAWRVVELASFLIVTPLRVAAQPTFAAMAREGRKAGDLLVRISQVTGVVAFPVFAGLAVVAGPFLDVVFGSEWEAAAPVLSILAVVGAFFCIDKVQQSFCLAAGKPGTITALSWLTVALGAMMAFLALPWGLAGVAAAVVAGYLLPWPFRIGTTARIAGLPAHDLMLPYVRPALVTAVMSAGVWAMVSAVGGGRPLVALAVGVATGVAVQGGLGLLLLRDTVLTLKSLMKRNRDP